MPKRPTARPITTETKTARVIANHGNRSVIQDGDQLLTASARRGKRPVCGDIVQYTQSSDNQGDIQAITPRERELARADFRGRRRVLAANLTQLLIVVAAKPSSSLELVDRYLVAAEHHDLKATIVINKCDLPEADDHFIANHQAYATLGYPVITSSTKQPDGLDSLLQTLHGENSILLGQSGVGKSSLTNHCLDNDHEIRVGELSERAQLGQHTTTATTWYPLTGARAGAILDSPGVRDFTLEFIPADELPNCMLEFRPYLGQCRFNNCLHRQEPDCAILAAVANGDISARRHASYLAMLNSLTELRTH